VGVRAVAVAAALAALVAGPPAHAQRTTFEGLRQCARLALVQFKRHNPGFRRFVIDRESVIEDKYADMVGNQFVATVYRGRATYEAASGPTKVRFVCLHGGISKGPVFVYTLPE